MVDKELCEHKAGELFGGAGTDIAEIIRYYAEYAESARGTSASNRRHI